MSSSSSRSLDHTTMARALVRARQRGKVISDAAGALRSKGAISDPEAESMAFVLYARLTGHAHPSQLGERLDERRRRSTIRRRVSP